MKYKVDEIFHFQQVSKGLFSLLQSAKDRQKSSEIFFYDYLYVSKQKFLNFSVYLFSLYNIDILS